MPDPSKPSPRRSNADGPQSEEPQVEAAETAEPTRSDAVEAVAKELEQVRRLAGELTSVLEQTIQRAQTVDEISKETTSELLVLLTAVRPLQAVGTMGSEKPPAIDEYIEDMIDPEFGLRPARTAILGAAERILRGHDAFHFPQPPSSNGSGGEPSDS